jgi:hypothetical protein
MLFALGLDLRELLKPVSIDETGQLELAKGPLAAIPTQFQDAQNHPLYGILAHVAIRCLPLPALLAGRMPAFVAGLLLPWVFFRGRRPWIGPEAAVLTAMLFIFVDPVKHYCTSARGYVLLMLGALVLADLLLAHLDRGGVRLLAGYVVVAVATCYAHLWTLPVLGAHAVFLGTEALRPVGQRAALSRLAWVLAAIVVAAALGLLAYAPMFPQIVAMGGHRVPGVMTERMVEALLQMIRYGSWTVAAYLVIVPVLLEGLARRGGERPFRDRAVRLHVTLIATVLLFAVMVNPLNFGGRFLLGIAPSVFALVGWALAGYWRGQVACEKVPVLPPAATCLIGLALGVFVANARLSHEIPPRSNAQLHDPYQGDYFHMLPIEVGNATAAALGAIGIAGLLFRKHLPRPAGRVADALLTAVVVFWTVALIAAIVPLALGPYAFQPRGLFEFHMLAVGAVAMLAWQHRFNDRVLRRLRYAFLACVPVAALWQAGFHDAHFELIWLARMLLYVPPLLIVLTLARTTRCAG